MDSLGRILIVDDEEGIRDILSRKLSAAHYQCLTAPTAEEALRLLEGDNFDLILSDMRMPGMSGRELLKQVVAQDTDAAIIMITAMDDTEMAVEVMKLGASDYILKPFDLIAVGNSVAKALEKRRVRLESQQHKRALEEQIRQHAQQLRSAFNGSVEALVRAIEAKNPYVRGHTERVSALAVATARELKIPEERIELIQVAGLLHDVGKIGISEAVLLKPGKLTPEEYAHVMNHMALGAYILQSFTDDGYIIDMVRGHHERYDGRGLPDHLSGEQIPLGSRILVVADSFDAMTSQRPYREAMSVDAACAELLRCSGTQFDPEIVAAFIKTGAWASCGGHGEHFTSLGRMAVAIPKVSANL